MTTLTQGWSPLLLRQFALDAQQEARKYWKQNRAYASCGALATSDALLFLARAMEDNPEQFTVHPEGAKEILQTTPV